MVINFIPFLQAAIKRHRAYSCNINRLSLVWDRLSTELQTTSSSTSHHECDSTLTHLQRPPNPIPFDGPNKTFINPNEVGMTEDIYGGSIINNRAPASINPKESDLSSVANCQTSLIQTSQNQCYIVVQLNLPNNQQNSQETAYTKYNRMNQPENEIR